ncbi:hypothetical protein [Brevibacillus sp. 1238]|nr:hypothetical protein [Brevibacillus sp. 1238]MDH6351913.1 hypothetical protein [Brevibacillus sp. 1238]
MVRIIVNLIAIALLLHYIETHPVETVLAMAAIIYTWLKGR